MFNKKGQAAMEYLMTYGWAILIVLAIMAILVYLVRPQQIETCQVAQPFQCEQDKYTINSTHQVKISLMNMGAVTYNISSANCPSTDNTNRLVGGPVQITPGSSATVVINCAASSNIVSNPQSGKDTFKEKLKITYYPANSPDFPKAQEIELVVKYS
ncbi:MAG: hypothetical protein QXF07_00015 [Candidatus Micrarchaeia archaeon]